MTANIYEDARRYDALTSRHFGGADLAYWQRQAALYAASILELACGNGRLTIPLAEQGFAITGLDVSEAMLEIAREKSETLAPHIQWHLADMADFNLEH